MRSLSWRIRSGLLLLALLGGCARPEQQAGPSQAGTQATAPASTAQAGGAEQPGAPELAPLACTIRINSNGAAGARPVEVAGARPVEAAGARPVEAAGARPVEADFSDPVEVLLQCPAPVDPASLEPLRRRLPEGTLLTFPDEQTARLLVWRRGSFAVDPNGIRSRDGKAEVKGTAPVQVDRKEYARATLYRVDDLLAGKREFAARWRLPYTPTGFALSPDRRSALLFPADPMIGGPKPSLLNLETGENRTLSLEDTGAYSAGGWLPDGRLYLQGRSLWLSADGGQSWKATATGLWSWVSRLSPQGGQIALWAPPGKVTVVDLNSGAKRELAEQFRRPAQDGASLIAWSPDGQWLAGSDFDSDIDGSGARIRLVDPSGVRPGKTIEGVRLVELLPDGKLLAWRSAPDRKGPEEGALLLIDPAGGERLLLDRWADPSPDGRYLVYTDWDGAMPVAYLLEVASGKRSQIPLIDPGRWTSRGELLVVEGPWQ